MTKPAAAAKSAPAAAAPAPAPAPAAAPKKAAAAPVPAPKKAETPAAAAAAAPAAAAAMPPPPAESSDDNLSLQVAKQGDYVRALKAAGAPKEEILKNIEKLAELRAALALHLKDISAPEAAEAFDRAGFENLLKRKYFVAPAFEIYGGVAGLYDLGPPGCAVKSNILELWRRHFVLEEAMLPIDCTVLTPEVVLKASGHVDRFTDFLVKDVVTSEPYRADHLLDDHLKKLLKGDTLTPEQRSEALDDQAQADAFDADELGARLTKWGVKAPLTGNDISAPYPWNLMFGTPIGAAGGLQGYLRPETAQGIFVNFRRLLEFNGGRMPFAAAQIGNAYRNEISPRWGLLRVREFTMAEIEHFVSEESKAKHHKFDLVRDIVLNLYSRDAQMTTRETSLMPVGEAVAKKIIDNETLAYFLARTHLFLVKCGIKPEKLRFRQHLKHEMAHYACDCWDAEIKLSYGWIECVGHADRSCFDLKVHTERSKIDLQAREDYAQPIEIDTVEITADKKSVGVKFGPVSSALFNFFKNDIEPDHARELQKQAAASSTVSVTVGETTFELLSEWLKFKPIKKKITGRSYLPHVVEPSFGIGRILYAILEHSYWVRPSDEQKKVLAFSPVVAPVKVVVLPLSSHPSFGPWLGKIVAQLTEVGLSSKVDDSAGSIGKRYARADEVGTPFALTVDFSTAGEGELHGTVTMRERDSTRQVRIKVETAIDELWKLCNDRTTWTAINAKYPNVTVEDD
eukprot:TRINITY_DN1437_c2_g1_i1.p1 TRINITY_DN1437_c2_g1~~TRINITY_DN1437_c2_g1_i1.p1  ORF type:complete len:797 (-),score=268.61 TRINITY_DN1437_c2_g1_i1:34-2256(-)